MSLEKRNEIIDLMASGELGAVTKHGLYLTVVIKRVNQKKHHSHRLFFDKWLPMHKSRLGQQFPHYAFCSDVGTLYGPRMLHVLMTYLDRHHNVAVCELLFGPGRASAHSFCYHRRPSVRING